MALIMKNGKIFKNCFAKYASDKNGNHEKHTMFVGNKLDGKLVAWPTNKDRLLYIINYQLSKVELEKLDLMTDEKDNKMPDYTSEDGVERVEVFHAPESEEESVEEVEEELDDGIDESEYIDLPDSLYEVEGCSEKVLRNIVKILSYRSTVIRDIRRLRKAKESIDRINHEIEKVVVYNIVLGKYIPILCKQGIIDKVNLKTATKLFEEVCIDGYQELPLHSGVESEIKKNKEKQDFDIVAAMSYCGVSVDKDDYGFYSVKSFNNGRGIKYFIGKTHKTFVLSKASCKKFVNEFLNNPIEKRKFITPGQVFISYINEAEKSLGINTRTAEELDGLFGEENNRKNTKQYFKDVIKKFSRNSHDWKDYQKTFETEYYANKLDKDSVNTMHIKQQAKRLVIGELFENFVNHDEILSQDQIAISDYRVSDISKDFGMTINIDGMEVDKVVIEMLEDQSFRLLSKIHATVQQMRGFTQDIIDNYTVDYLRKEKIFLLQQEDQKEYIAKKKEYEDLIKKTSYDKGKDSETQAKYFQNQINELVQKIGCQEYVESKEALLLSKNNYRILLINAKSQKEKVKIAIKEAQEKAEKDNQEFTIDDKLRIMKEVLSVAPELIVTFDRGKATSWAKHKLGEKVDKLQEPLNEVDRVIEETAARISDESHQKILQENMIREKANRSQKEERIRSANAYNAAYGSLMGNAMGVGAYSEPIQNVDIPTTPTFAPQVNNGNVIPQQPQGYAPMAQMPQAGMMGGNVNIVNGMMPISNMPQQSIYQGQPQQQGSVGNMYSPAMMGMPQMPMQSAPAYSEDYQTFDGVAESIEPCVIPYIVGYEEKGITVYGNMMERYAVMDRYKFLLTTNNNLLYTYLEGMKEKNATVEQIIADIHTRYLKNAMTKSSVNLKGVNLKSFNYKKDVRVFLTNNIAQNLVDLVLSDYNEFLETIDIELLRDLIQHKMSGDLESYIPEDVKSSIVKATNMIGSVIKAIMSDNQIRKTYDAYSNKMKQTYISSLIGKIDGGEIPSINLESEQMYDRILDYLSFSIKGQNVIIESDDAKNSGFETYPRSIYFRQKENADQALRAGKTLTFEQNEIITTRNEINLQSNEMKVINLFGTLFKFNGQYNKLLLKLKPMVLTGSVKFMENLIDALNENVELQAIVEEENKPQEEEKVPVIRFASKSKEQEAVSDTKAYDFEDDNWYVKKGFVLNKDKAKEYYLQLAFGFKYGLDKTKKQLKEDFYTDNILSLSKINEKFKDMPPEMISIITSVIREIMMARCERVVDLISYMNNDSSMQINKMLYINRVLLQSKNFNKKSETEKVDALYSLDKDFNYKSEDLVTPHPEIYSSNAEIEKYQGLYQMYGLMELFNTLGTDERFITSEIETYFGDLKKKFRSELLAMIREKKPMNGYEQELAKYFELKVNSIKDIDDKDDEQEDIMQKFAGPAKLVKIKNIDVIFKGIYEAYNNAIEKENDEFILDYMREVGEVLSVVGEMPGEENDEKDLEITLPNNQCIKCNIKGFLQQYLFRYIVNKDNELGPLAYVVDELVNQTELPDCIQNIATIAEKVNSEELGINLIAKFSSISLSNSGNILKIGDTITTVLDVINRLKSPEDQEKALARDVFYREGVQGVEDLFEEYFNRLKEDKEKIVSESVEEAEEIANKDVVGNTEEIVSDDLTNEADEVTNATNENVDSVIQEDNVVSDLFAEIKPQNLYNFSTNPFEDQGGSTEF